MERSILSLAIAVFLVRVLKPILERKITTKIYSLHFSTQVFQNPPQNLKNGFEVRPQLKGMIIYFSQVFIMLLLITIFLAFGVWFIFNGFNEYVLNGHNWTIFIFMAALVFVMIFFAIRWIISLITEFEYLVFLPKIKVYKNGLVIKKLFLPIKFVSWDNLVNIKFEDKTKNFGAIGKSSLIELIYRKAKGSTADTNQNKTSHVILYELDKNLLWLLGSIAYFKPDLEVAITDILKYYHLSKPSEAHKIVNIAKGLKNVFEKLPEHKGV